MLEKKIGRIADKNKLHILNRSRTSLSSFFLFNRAIYPLFFIITFILSGCDTKFNLPDKPQPIPQRQFFTEPRLALVLGGGGTKGMAHVGVLEEFERAGIKIDLLVGCSAGSIVAALYADRPNASEIKKILRPLKTWDILDISVWRGRYGFVQGGSLRNFLKRNLSCTCFEDLQIPLCVAATDLLAGHVICISTGPIIPAVHASSAVPFVFSPVILHERLLVDGGVADPVPVHIAKEMKASIIVAVDLSQMLEKSFPTNLFGVASRSAEIKFLLQSTGCIRGADIIIRPELGTIGMFDDSHLESTYEAGRSAAKKAIPKILELLSEHDLIAESSS